MHGPIAKADAEQCQTCHAKWWKGSVLSLLHEDRWLPTEIALVQIALLGVVPVDLEQVFVERQQQGELLGVGLLLGLLVHEANLGEADEARLVVGGRPAALEVELHDVVGKHGRRHRL